MKGKALLWLMEYVETCRCEDSLKDPLIPGYHVHSLPYRHRGEDLGAYYAHCKSWASELSVLIDFFMERGMKVGVVFESECVRESLSWWGKIGPGHEGEWDRYAQPTPAESLKLAVTPHMENIARLIRRLPYYDPGQFDAEGQFIREPTRDSRPRPLYFSINGMRSRTEAIFDLIQHEFDTERRKATQRAATQAVRFLDLARE